MTIQFPGDRSVSCADWSVARRGDNRRSDLTGGAGGGDRWVPAGEGASPEGYGHLGSRGCAARERNAGEEVRLRELQARDREVRAHEQAHVAALGCYAGVVVYEYEVGPDGRMYAVGGSTEIRPATGGSPEAKADRARRIRGAVMAVGEPSAADRQAMSEAVVAEAQARAATESA